MKAVIDRIVEGKAVLLAGDEEVEYVVDANLLPAGASEGDWVEAKLEGDKLLISHDTAETEQVKKRIDDKLAKLKNRTGGSKFSR